MINNILLDTALQICCQVNLRVVNILRKHFTQGYSVLTVCDGVRC